MTTQVTVKKDGAYVAGGNVNVKIAGTYVGTDAVRMKVNGAYSSGSTLPANTAPPVISGGTTIGSVLAAIPGVWDGNPTPTISGQWFRGANAIPGATSPTYTITINDSGSNLKYVETAVNPVGSATATSNVIHADSVPIGGIGFDNYSNGFARGYWNPAAHPTVPLLDGNYHYLKPYIATTPGPNGEIVADTAALAAIGGAAWFDNNGALGKFKVESSGDDITAEQMAAAIDVEAIIEVKYVDPDLLIKSST